METLLPHLHGWPPAWLTAHRTGYVRGICARVETGFPKYIIYNFSSRRKCQQRKLVPPCSVPATRCSPWYPRYFRFRISFSLIKLFFKPCSILPNPWYLREGKTLHFMHIHNRIQYFTVSYTRASELNCPLYPMGTVLHRTLVSIPEVIITLTFKPRIRSYIDFHT